ncbi:MAG: nucleotidyltransferase domain-containing protein [Chloroflexota bacterium]|nr:nucleotidyltransferase domain-containing protein [Chloroflexota bacterium]
MIALVEEKKDDIAALCRRFSIQRLDLFGSAATGDFDPATSDLDFVVDLGDYDDIVHRRYLDLIAGLEDLLGYAVHMTTSMSIKNPYFREAFEEQRELVYEKRNRKEAA